MFCKVYKENLVEPNFNFTCKNCKGACFFDFVGFLIPYVSGNSSSGLDPRICKMDV